MIMELTKKALVEKENERWGQVERDKRRLPRKLVVTTTGAECYRLWHEFVEQGGEREWYTAVSFTFESETEEVEIERALRGLCSEKILVVGRYYQRGIRFDQRGTRFESLRRRYWTVLVFRYPGEGAWKEFEDGSVAFKEFCDKYVDEVVTKKERDEWRGGLAEALAEMRSDHWGKYFGDTWVIKMATTAFQLSDGYVDGLWRRGGVRHEDEDKP